MSDGIVCDGTNVLVVAQPDGRVCILLGRDDRPLLWPHQVAAYVQHRLPAIRFIDHVELVVRDGRGTYKRVGVRVPV